MIGFYTIQTNWLIKSLENIWVVTCDEKSIHCKNVFFSIRIQCRRWSGILSLANIQKSRQVIQVKFSTPSRWSSLNILYHSNARVMDSACSLKAIWVTRAQTFMNILGWMKLCYIYLIFLAFNVRNTPIIFAWNDSIVFGHLTNAHASLRWNWASVLWQIIPSNNVIIA